MKGKAKGKLNGKSKTRHISAFPAVRLALSSPVLERFRAQKSNRIKVNPGKSNPNRGMPHPQVGEFRAPRSPARPHFPLEAMRFFR